MAKQTDLHDYEGNVVLVVNVASKSLRFDTSVRASCKSDVRPIQETKDFVDPRISLQPVSVSQEPGTDAEIKQFCSTEVQRHLSNVQQGGS